MEIRTLPLNELQPTDTLRPESVSFLVSLTLKQIRGLGLPQIWETSIGLLISDGNNRAGVLAKKGEETIQVDYIPQSQRVSVYGFGIEELVQRAQELRAKGIYTPRDLWQA